MSDERRQPTLEELRASLPLRGTKKRGLYAGSPGGGPAGETCRTCKHKTYTGQSKPTSHPKCGLVKYTAGDATTILTSTPACRYWEPKG